MTLRSWFVMLALTVPAVARQAEPRFHSAPNPLAAGAVTSDWPCLLGPNHNETSPEKHLLQRFPTEGPKLVWEIERRLIEDVARPVIFYPRGATCRYPQVKNLTIMVNSIYNGWRFEDLWLDK